MALSLKYTKNKDQEKGYFSNTESWVLAGFILSDLADDPLQAEAGRVP